MLSTFPFPVLFPFEDMCSLISPRLSPWGHTRQQRLRPELCSILVEIILLTPKDSTADLIIMLFDSVPPLVKMISEGETFSFSAIYFLESSNNDLELLPNE